ncbi:MAG TPA: phosphatase PAP2 family protein, partial [Anaerovoracaceae bacterium]|nr:phosphatase PAP2 family protein [Anaerovoracaceae bacterium]
KENRAQKALISLLVVLIVLIGFSRVYLGVHYPTDVLAGWFLGISILVSAIILLEKGYTERIKFGKFKLK